MNEHSSAAFDISFLEKTTPEFTEKNKVTHKASFRSEVSIDCLTDLSNKKVVVFLSVGERYHESGKMHLKRNYGVRV